MMEKKYPWSQRGSVLILMAFFVPMIMAVTGMVVDFGNVYWHKSVLQNCADASALGGAKAGSIGGAFNQKTADEMAVSLHKKNKRYASQIIEYDGYKSRYCGSKSDPNGTHYYIVTMTEKVPMFFLRYFGYEEMEISASANVLIKSTGIDPLSCLFCYRDELVLVNTVRDNDGEVIKSFDGNIVYTNDRIPLNQYDKNLSSHLPNGATNVGTSNVKHLYKTKGYKDLNNVDKNDISDPIFQADMKLHVEKLDKKIKEQYNSTQISKIPRHINNTNLDNGNSFYCSEPGMVLTINNYIKGDAHDPVYIYVRNCDVDLKVYADTVRPIIICQIKDPDDPWGHGGRITVEGSDKGMFRGVIYMPDCSEVLINEHNMAFIGTIIAPTIKTQDVSSYKASFTYERFIKSEGGGLAASSEISLSDDNDIDWKKKL